MLRDLINNKSQKFMCKKRQNADNIQPSENPQHDSEAVHCYWWPSPIAYSMVIISCLWKNDDDDDANTTIYSQFRWKCCPQNATFNLVAFIQSAFISMWAIYVLKCSIYYFFVFVSRSFRFRLSCRPILFHHIDNLSVEFVHTLIELLILTLDNFS